MDSTQLLRSRIEDLIRESGDRYYITKTGFLDLHEQAVAAPLVRNTPEVRAFFYGGYEDAERKLLLFAPSGMANSLSDILEMEEILRVIRVHTAPGGRKLSHRDYLGSVLGLGIDRKVIGDILVREDGADLIVQPEIAPFLIQEYHFAGRTAIRAEERSIRDLEIPDQRMESIRDTVPSLRLDNVLSAAFRISRSEAARAIRSGIVSVDHLPCVKSDRKLEQGTVLSVKGRGKAVLKEVGGESKKGRIWIEADRYI